MTTLGPTIYPDVNALLGHLLAGACSVLGNDFVGLYPHGLPATGASSSEVSNGCLLAATVDPLPEETAARRVAIHRDLPAADSHWAAELEGSYITWPVLRRHNPAHAHHPHIERGSSALSVEQHDRDLRITGVTRI